MQFRVVVDGESHEIDAQRRARGLVIRVDGANYPARVTLSRATYVVRIGPRTYRVRFRGREVSLDDRWYPLSIPVVDSDSETKSGKEADEVSVREIRAPMPGRVVRILVAAGTRVSRGQVLLVLEAMKMQNEIPAPRDGIVREVRVSEGDLITADRVVAVLEAR
jgi:biotin carboxyl carrier protein